MRARLSLLLLCLLALVACRERSNAPRAAQPDLRARTFVWTSAEPRSIDPTFVSDTPGALLALNLFEGLYVPAPGDGAPRAGLAVSHEVSADGLEHTFGLRPEARWSDGEPVTAGDFVFAWRRMLNPATGAPGAEDLWRLVGARAYHAGENGDPRSVGVRAEGPLRLVVRLAHPDPLFVDALATSRFLPVPRHAVEAQGERWTRPGVFVGNGPFRLAAWEPRDRLVLERSETWWGRADVALERAVLRVVESEALAVRLYEVGEVDYTPGQVPFEQVVRLREQGSRALRLDPYLGVAYLAFNLRQPPFDDVRVRRAFDRAVDKRGLIAAVLRGGQQPATHLVPEGYEALVGYEGPRGPQHDPEAARALLAEAGYPGGAGFPAVRLSCNTSDVLARMMAHVARDLRQNLGVQVEVVQSEWKSFLAAVQRGEFQLARYAMQGGVDPAELVSIFRKGGPNNIGGYANDAYDARLDEIRTVADREARMGLVAACERQLVDDVVVLPLYFYTRPALLRPRVRGFEAQSLDIHLLRYLSLSTK